MQKKFRDSDGRMEFLKEVCEDQTQKNLCNTVVIVYLVYAFHFSYKYNKTLQVKHGINLVKL
jgi:hypothetical protein